MAKKIIIDLDVAGFSHIFISDEKNNLFPVRYGNIEDMKIQIYKALSENQDINDIVLIGHNNHAEGFKEELLNDVVKKYYCNRKVRIYINDEIFN